MSKINKNKGFSLIELIVTIAVMSIVVLISVNLYGLIRNADTKSAAGNIDTMISSLRSKSLTKNGEYKLCIEMDADKNYSVVLYEYKVVVPEDGLVWKIIESENLGKVTISVLDSAGNEAVIDADNILELKCSKSNGSFINSKYLKSDETDFEVTQIKIVKGNSMKRIKLVLLTGRHYIY